MTTNAATQPTIASPQEGPLVMLDDLDQNQRTLIAAAIALVTGPADQDTWNRIITDAMQNVPRKSDGTEAHWLLLGQVVNIARMILTTLDPETRDRAIRSLDRITVGLQFDEITKTLD